MNIPTLSSICFRFWLLGAALLAVGPLRGEIDRYAGGNWALLDPKTTLAAAADITLAKHPDCDEATVEEKIVDVYRADGTGENQDEAFTKVLTEKGLRDRRTLSLGFELPYSTVQVVKLEIMKPSGEVATVDIAANSKVAIDHSQIQMNVYDPNSKILQVNIPGLEIGDVVHAVTRTTIERPVIPGEFADENIFEGEAFIRHLVYEVHAPLDKPLKHVVLRDEVAGTVKYTMQPGGSEVLHRWEVTNVPRIFAEPSMPPSENVLQRVLVSTTPTWQDVSKWYWQLSQAHLDATSPELKQKVVDLTAAAKTDPDKVKALFYYVSQKIRYMGLTPEKDRPGFEPHDVCLTFGKKYGVCRDKAALLVSMLRLAGLHAYPVLVDVGSKKDKEVPDAGFNHAIVCVELKKGEYTLMDPTDEHARDLLPWADGDQSYLVTRPEGEDIQVSAVIPPEHNLMRIRTTGVLQATGELEAKSEISFDGANDDIYRDAFSHMKPDNLRRFFEGSLKVAMPGARITSLKLTPLDMLDVSQEIKAEIEYSVSGMTATGNGKAIVSLPWIGQQMGMVNYIIRGLGLDQRKYPLQTQLACGLHEEIALKLGDGLAGAESTPSCTPVDDDCMSYHQSVAVENGTLACSRELKLKGVEFSPAQYAELKKTLQAMEYDARKAPVLATTSGGAGTTEGATAPGAVPAIDSDAVILDSHKELAVTDAHTAVLKMRYSKLIMTYAGKVREAEVKVDFNPACETVKLIRGVVTSKAGQRQEISPSEINLMDADWVASAKRYTGGKILVANLPAVEIGSTIDVEYEVTMKNKPFISRFEAFQLADELRQKSFQLTAPAGVKIEKMITGGGPIPAEVQSADQGGQVYRWSAEKMKALPNEEQLPPDWICTPGVTIFAGDYKAYLQTLNDTLLNRSQSGTKAGELARQIAGPGLSRMDAMKAIRDFVAKSIRLAGPSFTRLPLSELSAADTTLADGYGHAADRAILLHAMLSAAGFQPRFVLASELPPVEKIKKIATSFPLPASFDEPLVKVTLDGTNYYLNDTDQYAQLGSTAHDDKLGIDLLTQADEVIAAAQDCRDKTATVYTLSIGDSGKLRMGVTKQFYGGEYNTKNRYFSELLPEERKRYYQALISDVAQGARPVGDLTTQFGTYPGSEQFTVELDNYAVADGKYLYFHLPFKSSLFALPAGDLRRLPFGLSQEERKSIRTEIDLPPGFRKVVIAPKSESLDGPQGSGTVRMTSSTVEGKYVLTDDLETAPAIISPEDYPAILKLESTLEKKSADVFLLQKE